MSANQAGQYKNPNYIVTLKTSEIKSKEQGYLNIEGYLPESLAINLTASWDNVLKDFLSGADITKAGGWVGALASGANTIMDLLGMKTAYSQISSYPTWTGTEPIQFSIPFRFDAVNDTNKDVVEPWVNLMKLVCPMKDGELLTAPGPSITFDKETKVPLFNKSRVLSLSIGKFIYIRGVVVTSVSNTLFSKFDINGKPIQAEADVTLRTVFSPTVTDIENWFSYNESYGSFETNFNEATEKISAEIKKSRLGNVILNKLGGTQEVKQNVQTSQDITPWFDKPSSSVLYKSNTKSSVLDNYTNYSYKL